MEWDEEFRCWMPRRAVRDTAADGGRSNGSAKPSSRSSAGKGKGWRRGKDCGLNTLGLRDLAKRHGLSQFGTKAHVLQRLLGAGVAVPGMQPVSGT